MFSPRSETRADRKSALTKADSLSMHPALPLRLWTVSPLVVFICWGYAITNVGLGLGMLFLYRNTTAPIAVADILPYSGWGVVFLFLASVAIYGLIRDNWLIVRYSQIAGLIVKAVWAVALIVRCLEFPQTILITMVWLFFAYIQFGAVLFFPRSEHHG